MHETDRASKSGSLSEADVEIKKASTAHLEQIEKIEEASFASPWSRESIKKEIERGNTFVAEKNGEVLGYIMRWKVKDEIHITNLAVKPEFRRRGIASLLLKHVLKEKAHAFYLEVRSKNLPAINLYKKFGFKELYRRKAYYLNDDAIVMVLTRHPLKP